MGDLTDLFKEKPKNPYRYQGPDLAMLVVGHDGGDSLLYCVSGESIENDLDGFGVATAELLVGSDPPGEPGVHVWEGKVKWYNSHNPDEGAESDYEDGKWRKPTPEEWGTLMKGERPWPKVVGNPEYCALKDKHVVGTGCHECWFGWDDEKE